MIRWETHVRGCGGRGGGGAKNALKNGGREIWFGYVVTIKGSLMCGSDKGGPTRKSGVLVAGQVKRGGGVFTTAHISVLDIHVNAPPPPGSTCIIVHDLSASTVTSQDKNALDFVDRHYVDSTKHNG